MLQQIDNNAILDAREASDELRDLARVIKAALGVAVAYWVARTYPPTHPYRQAARMVISYLERRYGV